MQKLKFKIIIIFFLAYSLQLTAYSCFADNTKQPDVAGQFYTANPDALRQEIEGFLKNANPGEIGAKVLCLVSPHAGYQYSGQVAAYGYKAIKGIPYDTVVVIAISHRSPFNGIAIWPKGKFLTPLGEIPVDEDICRQLLVIDPNIKEFPQAFSGEHSLEVQLPFLQTTLKSQWKLVPLIIGQYNLGTCEILARALTTALKNKNALIIASSDMSHFYQYSEAKRIDEFSLSLIKNHDIAGLSQQSKYGSAAPCGSAPILTVLYYAKENNINGLKVLKYANSGDVTGDLSRVVGYASIALYQESDKVEVKVEAKGEGKMLNKDQRRKLLDIARRSIEVYLKDNKRLEIKETDPELLKEKGAFVTLTEHGRLRGCIGHIIGNLPLINTISQMAAEAAVNDPRFYPITLKDFPDIEIEISVLSPLEKITDINKIEVGKHGILMRRGFNSGLLLPQVATEYGWDRQTFLEQTCNKAGLPPDAYKDAEIYIFSAEVFNEKKY